MISKYTVYQKRGTHLPDIPVYEGKPTVYLDHNILDKFVNNKMQDLFNQLKEEYRVVYSLDNLKEILRSGEDYHQKFLDVLILLDACYLELITMPPSLKATGRASITKIDIYEKFDDYKNRVVMLKDAADLMNEQIYAILSGKNSDIVEKANDNNGYIMTNKIDSIVAIENAFDIFDENYPHLISTSKETREMVKGLLDKENEEELKKYTADKNIDSEISAQELCNIPPENALYEIWELYKNKGPRHDIDEFFGSKFTSSDPNKEYHEFEKISNIYDALNVLGYYRDEGVYKKMKRFTSASSDTGHAAMASFTSMLFSYDKNFIIKTDIAYKYLNICTKIVNPDIINGS